ncbi:MAG: carbohydrate ABC transporter permease [Planctomycetes bacterium]|nr:carbohydrate ABC transporter permease [Planctomycetota bacterium]
MTPSPSPALSPWALIAKAVGWILMAGLALAFFAPFLWMALSAMKPAEKIFSEPWAPPERLVLEPFIAAFQEARFGAYFWNSLVVTAASVAGTVLFGGFAGYALARWRFRGQNATLALFLIGLILPVQAYLIPLRLLIEALGLLDTRWALIFPYMAMELPIAVYILRAFFLSLPRELGESAALDGASPLAVFFHIYLPLALPAAASVAVLAALSVWNEFLLAFLFIHDESLRTVPSGLLAFQGIHSTDYQLLFAGLTIVSAPLIAVYVLAQRFMIEGLTAGALKG